MLSILTRSRLIQGIERALDFGHVLLEAPAGYGKTVLLRQLTGHFPGAHLVSLSPGDIDLIVFQALVQPLLRPKTILLLDDVHLLEGGKESVGWLQAQLETGQARWVLACRRSPFDSTMLSISGQLAHFRADDLAFSLPEMEALLGERQDHRIADLYKRLEGWPLGVGLLARLPERGDSFREVKTQLFSYLAKKVFDSLPPKLRHFIHVTAIPLKFNDELATFLLEDNEARAFRQEAEAQNLFLYPDEAPGWFRYHELIREFLLDSASFDVGPVFKRCVTWFHERGDLETAIEQALAGKLQEWAAQLMDELPATFVHERGRYLTYHRWVERLDPAVQEANPHLLLRACQYVYIVNGFERVALQYAERVQAIADRHKLFKLSIKARIQLVWIRLNQEGSSEAVLAELQTILANPHCQGEDRLRALKHYAANLGWLARFRDARNAHQEAIELAGQLGDAHEVQLIRRSLALYVLVPLGEFAPAEQIYKEVEGYFSGRPGWRAEVLGNTCDLWLSQGHWQALDKALDEIAQLSKEVETTGSHIDMWVWWYRAMLSIGKAEWQSAMYALTRAEAISDEDPYTRICLTWAHAWLARRTGLPVAAVAQAEKNLGELPHAPPFSRTIVSLERDIAQAVQSLADPEYKFRLHEETAHLVYWRARAEIVRLRMLLAVVCAHAGIPRWRRHFHAARWASKLPGYERLLTQRDPDLAAQFWVTALAEGLGGDAELAEIGQIAPLLRLLKHADPTVRVRTAGVLAAIGDEAAIPPLAAALETERHLSTRNALQSTLDHLEVQPPPPLEIRLMGVFRLTRGGKEISSESFPRPIVLRLLQYFALHRGKNLSRDRILDDLWPETPPENAWDTFRTVYSRLRKVLEPYQRPRASSRYFGVEGDTYRFDPVGVARVDAEQFVEIVHSVLAAAQRAEVPPLPQDFIATLERWQSLLPELPYEEWLLAPRQRLDDAYLEGCQYAARATLMRGDPVKAAQWAQRVVEAGPWLEEGYQTLMRAYARQGQRAQALKVYEQAETALARELAVEPVELTRWLRSQLERGEEI